MGGTTGGFPDPPQTNGQPANPRHPEEYGAPTYHSGPAYSAPPPAYGNPDAYGNPSAPGSPNVYGNPNGYGNPEARANPSTYGNPAAYGNTNVYGNPDAHGNPNAYGNPGVSPQNYSYPVASPQQAVQPYEPRPAAPLYQQTAALAGPRLVTAGGRFGALLLDGLLMLVTLGIGWIVWSLFTWSDGQSPAKKLLGHVVADPITGAAFDWGRMALREFCIKGLLGWVLNLVSFGIYSWVDAFMCLSDRQRTLHDRMANSVVRYL
jgi:hypothetical protein